VSAAIDSGAPDTWSEAYRHQCEVRQLLRWRQEKGREWAHEFINGRIETMASGRRAPVVKGVRQQRGDAAADRLMEDCRAQWAAGNTGEDGVWLS
jgi:hypothetical protein